MTSRDLAQRVRELVSQNKIKAAISLLSKWFRKDTSPLKKIEWKSFERNVALISRRFYAIQENRSQNLVSYDDFDTLISQIANNLLELVDSIEKFDLISVSNQAEVNEYERFKLFFGITPPTSILKIVYGLFEAYTPDPTNEKREIVGAKYYRLEGHGEVRKLKIKTTFREFIGTGDLRSIIHLLSGLSWNQIYSPEIVEDFKIDEFENNSIICIGSPAANQITDILLHKSKFAKQVCSFQFPELDKPFEMKFFDHTQRLGNSGNRQEYSLERDDYTPSILLRVKIGHSPNFTFICAGLRGSGTAAASYFLAKNWIHLSNEFEDQEFAIFLESAIGIDKSVEWTKKVHLDKEGKLYSYSATRH